MSKQFLPLIAAIPLHQILTQRLLFSCLLLCCLAVQLPASSNFLSEKGSNSAETLVASIVFLDLIADLNANGNTNDTDEIENDGAGTPNSFNGNGIIDVETCNSAIPNQTLKIQIRCDNCPDDATYEYDLSINNFNLVATNEKIGFDLTTIPLDGTDLMIGNNTVTVELYEVFGGSRTLIDTRSASFLVSTMDVLACNDEVNIGINQDCASAITADALIEAPCDDGFGQELVTDYILNFTLVSVAENFVNSRSIPMPGIIDNETSAVTLQIPGRYRYSVTLGDNTCWGFVNLEDKNGPICDPGLDVEVPVDWDHDCNPATRPVRRPDPSGVDDLAPEYILCEILAREGVDIFFDELEAQDGFVDYDNDGVQDSNEPSFRGDFQDCGGVKEVFFIDEEIDVCDLSDLNNIPIDINKYDVNTYEICSIYTRTWFAVDNTDRQSATGCTQYVFGLRPKKSRIQLDREAAVECGVDLDESATFPYYIVQPNDLFNNGAGSVNSFPFNKEYQLTPFQNSCKYTASYHEDPQIPICGTDSEAYKQNRHWSVTDWCNGARIYADFTQLIKVEDTTAPVACLVGTDSYIPTDTTIVTQLFECTAEGNIPELYLKDACSVADFYEVIITGTEDGSYTDGGVYIPNLTNGADITALGLKEGNYRIIYRFEDVCGNRGEVTINLTFIDPRFPQAICNDELNVTLIPGDNEGDQRARVYAEDLDDTSSDNCHPLVYHVRLGDGSNGDWVDYVEFDCSNTNDSIKVELRVTGDANDNERVDTGELSSICWTYINIEDNTAPQLNANDGAFFCDDPEFSRLLTAVGEYQPNSDFLFPEVIGSCNADGVTIRLIDIDFTHFDPICQVGDITRDFIAVRTGNSHTFTSRIVTQTISVLFRSDWTMKFPTDMMIECVPTDDNRLASIPAPARLSEILTNRGCDQWGLETNDEVFDILGQDGNGACFKVIRTYKFINWCTWDPTNTETGIVPRPLDFFTDPNLCVTLDYMSEPVSNICDLQNKVDDGLERLNDPYDLVFGNNGNSSVDLISEIDADFIYVDEDGQQGGSDFFGQGDCIADGFNASFNSTIDFAPTTSNELIDDNQTHNFVSAEAYGYFIYRQVIKVIDDAAPMIVQIADTTLCEVGNACVVNYKLPIPEVTDCSENITITYQVDINRDGDTNDGNENGRILGNAIDGFTTPLLNSLTYGVYTITYLVNDGCGNVSKITFDLTAQDCKPPVAYCRGVALELMPTGMVELWAKDLDAGSFDPCLDDITLSFDAAGTEMFRTFTCDDVGSVALQLFVTDPSGNQSICETFVIIQTNEPEECDFNIGAAIAGQIMTEIGEEVQGSMVSINGTMEMEVPTDVNGEFTMAVEMGGDYTISAVKDVQPLNGVSTFDMVLIRKHILGVLALGSPYKLIAADVNNSRTVTTLDMVQLRKLILGVETEFENNTSWRFVDAAYEFPEVTNPWSEDFPEVVSINNIADRMTNANFVAVKIGDVNDSTIPNTLVGNDERNQQETWKIEVAEQKLQNGNTYEVPFYASDLSIEGYQFTLNLDLNKVELLEIKNGSATEDNFSTTLLDEGMITASWVGDQLPKKDHPLFTLVLKSYNNGLLSQAMEITSDFTKSEAYPLNNNAKNISLNFIFGTNIEDDYMLAQNSPNPFLEQTTIHFTLPHATTAVLTITDVSGKTVWTYEGAFTAGLQSVTVEKADLKSNGVFFYHLKADAFQATRRMINLAK